MVDWVEVDVDDVKVVSTPFEKYHRQIGSWNLKVRGKNKKYLKLPHSY